MNNDPCPTEAPRPTDGDGYGNPGYGNPKPTKQPKKTPKPTKQPKKTPKPTKGPKTPRPIKEKPTKAPRPTKGEKTPRPTAIKTPRPTKGKKTPRPTPWKSPKPTKKSKAPKPTAGTGYGGPRPSRMEDENDEEMIAVDLNGSVQAVNGYPMQTEIVGLLSIATVLVFCGYASCKRQEEDKYVVIDDQV